MLKAGRVCRHASRLFATLLCAVLSAPTFSTERQERPHVQVFAPAPCLTCVDWAEHLRKQGFTVTVTEASDLTEIKKRLKVPKDLESRHTSTVAGYFIEGHVPAEDIIELLKEKPKARGLAVPGLPRGAPGLEFSNPTCETACTMLDNDSGMREVRREMFETQLVLPDGSVKRWARH
jgi:hypothetical protein